MLKNIFMGILGAVIVVAIAASAYTAMASPETGSSLTLNAGNANGGGNGQGGNGQAGNEQVGNTQGGNGQGEGLGTSVLDIPASDLSIEETAALLYMREEEKLARDVYNFLFTLWGQPTFQNISASEQAHMDEIKILLDRYGLTDPAQAPGEFSDAGLQVLYTQLTTRGSVSLGEALKVGAAIEEIDILDLQDNLARTDNADIQLAFTNLMNASHLHLRSFTSVLFSRTGETYQPQYLSLEQYQGIVSNTTGNGNQGQGAAAQSGNRGFGRGYAGGRQP